MSDKLQSEFDVLSDRHYDRANNDWICGRICDAKLCPNGPTKDGKCRADFECVPARHEDSWVCTRVGSMGGKCTKGPYPDGKCCNSIQPCVPSRSLRNLRYQFSIAVFGLAIGCAAIFLAFPAESEMISPGALCKHHATTANSCSDCHSVDNQGLVTWVNNAVNRTELVEQNEKCLKCHKEIGRHALQPHSLPKEYLEKLTGAKKPGGTSSSFWASVAKNTFGSPHLNNNLHCASCHQEHQGPENNLSTLTNQQCQICHADTFHSFEKGHPEFVSYPGRRRTRIYFDHVSHYGKHFADKTENPEVEIACTQCHSNDASDSVMQLKGFDAACASCHEDQITDDLIPGLAVLGVPSLDLDSLKDAGLNVGKWPDTNRKHGLAKNQIPELMALLLADQPKSYAIQKKISELDLSNLQNAEPKDLALIQDFVWMLKSKLAGWVSHGSTSGFNQDLLGLYLGNQIPSAQVNELVHGWFPGLDGEINARANGTAVGIVEAGDVGNLSAIAQEQMEVSRSIKNGWYLQESDLTLRYRATGHADEFLTKTMELVAAIDNDSEFPRSIKEQLFESVASPFVSGRCMKCHTIDRGESGTKVNWFGMKVDKSYKDFTRFVHGPHLTDWSNSECIKCHKFDRTDREESGIFRSEFIDHRGKLAYSNRRFRCDFESINKQNCSQCHTAKSAGDSCISCHNYHVR